VYGILLAITIFVTIVCHSEAQISSLHSDIIQHVQVTTQNNAVKM